MSQNKTIITSIGEKRNFEHEKEEFWFFRQHIKQIIVYQR